MAILSDVKVIDLTHFVAGPFCTKLLADYGADVLKIERPGAGDPARRLGPFPGDLPNLERSGLFLFLNTNKRGITLDLKSPVAVDIVKRLAANADVLVENFRPGVMAEMGLDYETLSKVNPRLVYTSVSNFGQTGPYRDYKASEIVGLALGGSLLICGEEDREPVRLAGPQAQFHAGLVATVATMSALRLARMTGEGQQVDASLMESEVNIHELDIMSYPYSGEHHMKRMGSFVGHYPWTVYACSDGLVTVCLNNRQWRRVGDWLGMPELSKNPDYATPAQRLARIDELEAILVPWFAERTAEEATTSAQKFGVPVLPVYNAADMLQDRHFRAKDCFIDIDHPVVGRLTYPNIPVKMAPSADHPPRPAPLLGQHNQEVYCGELGFSREELLYFSQREAYGENGLPGLLSPPWERTKACPACSRNGEPVAWVRDVHPQPSLLPSREKGLQGRSCPMPLSGIRVIDLTISWAGPKVTQCLADMGAEVIKVESIQYMDAQRGRKRAPAGMCHYPDKQPGERPWNRYDGANQMNRNKLSLTLDLNRPEGKQIFRELVAVADVVVDSFSPRVMPKFGFGYDALKAIRPDIIVMAMPAFGMSGPYRDYVSWGSMLEGMAGLASARGYPDSQPFMFVAYSDPICGLMGAYAVLMALHQRGKTGQGQFIDLAQLEAFMPLSAGLVMDYSMNRRTHGPEGNRHSYMAPHGVYRCRGQDDWIAISVSTDAEWRGLVEAMCSPGWAADPRFSTSLGRWQDQTELDYLIQEWSCRQDKFEAMHRLQAAGVPAGAALSEKEQFEDPHLRERGLFEVVKHPDAGTHSYPGVTWKLSKTPGHIRLPAPCLGEHNRFVLRDVLGLSDGEIAKLEADQVIGAEPVEGADA